MTAVQRFIRPFGLLVRLEPTYKDPTVTLSPTVDGVQLADRIDWEFAFASDGSRKTKSSAVPGMLQAVAPSGRTARATIPFELKGSGSAYATATDVVPNAHALLRASGYAATLAGGTWTYSPQLLGDAGASVAALLYGRGFQQVVRGGLASLTLEAADTGPVMVSFDLNGVAPELPSDVAVPAITYPGAAQLPTLGNQLSLAIGGFSAGRVRSFKFSQNRSIDTARVNLNEPSGHAGFAPGDSDPTLEVVVEQTPLSGVTATSFDPFLARSFASVVSPVTLTLGGAGGSGTRCRLVMVTAQVADFAFSEDGEVSLLTLTIKPYTDGRNTAGNASHVLEFS